MDFEPKSDLLWFFIARALYLGIVCYLVVLAVALLRDLIRRFPSRSNTPVSLHFFSSNSLRSLITPSPDTRIFYYVEICRFCLNVIICVIYVMGTYRQYVEQYMSIIYDVFVGFFIFDTFENLIFTESAISHVFRPVVFFDVFTYPSLVLATGPDRYLNFAFLRAVVAYDSFAKLEKRLFIQVFGPRRIFIKLVFQCVTLFYTLAACIQLLEVPGDLLSVEFRDRWFEFGEWNFVNSLYFIIVTLSTVGYGDFSPSTVQGRIFTLFIIIVGIVVFTTVISQLVEHTRRGRGSGWFVKNSHTRHVIVTGTPTMTDLSHFISEFYSDSRHSNLHAKVVVMVENPLWTDTEWFQHIARNQFLQARLQFLIGSVRNQLDLQRARISSADAVFILTSPSTGEKPSIQDGRTIINTLAIRNVRTDIPIYAQTLLEDSNLQTEIALRTASTFSKEDTYFRNRHIGKHSQYPGLFHKVLDKEFKELPRPYRKEGHQCFEDVLHHYETRERQVDIHNTDPNSTSDLQRSQHVCLQEVHMALISGNLKANGVGTLLSNMYLDVRTAKLSKEEPSWLAEYHMGAACALTYAVVPKALHEVTIKDIAIDLFHLGVLIIATSDPRKVQPRPVLGTDMFLRYGDLALLLTYHEYKYVCAAFHLVALRYARGELRHSLSRSSGSEAIPGTSVSGTKPTASLDIGAGQAADAQGKQPLPLPFRSHGLFSSPPPSPAIRYANISGDDLDALADAAMRENGRGHGLLASGTSEALLEEKTDGYMPDNLKGHIILAMEGDAPVGNLPLLLRNLWRRGTRRATQDGRKAKVVVVHPNIEQQFRQRFARFEGISLFFVEGPPTSRATWKKARLDTAKSVATLADYTKPWSLSDARTIFTLLTLDISTSVDHDLFICSELVDEKSLEFLREPIHPRRRGASLGESGTHDSSILPIFQRDSISDPNATNEKLEKKKDRNEKREKKKDAIEKREKKKDAIEKREKKKDANEKREKKKDANEKRERKKDETIENQHKKKEVTLEVEPPRSVAPDALGDNDERPGNVTRKLTRRLGMDRALSTGGRKSVRSLEFKSFVKSAIPSSETPEGDSEDYGADPSTRPGAARARRGTLFSRSRYASGELLVQSSAITLLAREYIEPGFVKFFTSILGTEASSPGMKIRLVRIPEAMFEPGRGFTCHKGRKLVRFNDVFKILVQVGVTPIGIYRSGVAPALIPSKVRRKRGPAIFEELSPLLSEDNSGTTSPHEDDTRGFLNRAKDMMENLFDEILPHRRREAKGREEIDGKVDDSSSNEFSSEEDEIMFEEQELEDFENPAESEDENANDPERVTTSDTERLSKRGSSSLRMHSSSLAAWLSPKRNANTSKFFFDDDDSLEVPGQVKYTERKDTGNLLPYVFTLPDPNTWCAETDGVYIFCHPSFELPSKWSESTAFPRVQESI